MLAIISNDRRRTVKSAFAVKSLFEQLVRALRWLHISFRFLFIDPTPATLAHPLEQPLVRAVIWAERQIPALREPEPADDLSVTGGQLPISFHQLQHYYPTRTYRQAFQDYITGWTRRQSESQGSS